VPNNMVERGWPDRLIQLPNSVVVACELKRVFVNLQNYYLLTELRQEQCAWLAKWQRHGGKCLVFVGIVKFNDLVGFHCLTQTLWSNWLQANKSKYVATKILTPLDVVVWFKEYAGA
jgi:hypothetical protein